MNLRNIFQFGLAARVTILSLALFITAGFVIYSPSISSFRTTWLSNRMIATYGALLLLDGKYSDLPKHVQEKFLDSINAYQINIYSKNKRDPIASKNPGIISAQSFDLYSAEENNNNVSDAFNVLFSSKRRVISVLGPGPTPDQKIEVILDEGALKDDMIAHSIKILIVIIFVALFLAFLYAASVSLMILKPIRRLTESLLQFGDNPDDKTLIIKPSGGSSEITSAEKALAKMQSIISKEIGEKRHLANLGLAVSKINHDLRNMLASVQIISDRMAETQDPLGKKLAPKLVAALDRAIRFCETTLTYGRGIEREPEKSNVILSSVLDEAVEIVIPETRNNIEILNNVAGDIKVHVDREHLLRVIINLVRNSAIAFSSEQDENKKYFICFDALKSTGKIVLEVKDNGPGIPENKRNDIFKPFQASAQRGGTGLGLAIAAELLQINGGEIALMPSSDRFKTIFQISLQMPQ